ncbi:PAS domain-containing sensor histidine kinase [Agromyces sp. C10]|uniref:sensor histidine kinase n=1 Tax=Agromyces sp. C10 TaxID=2935077 RepID=UPI00200A471D|nr:PAS domain-containing sensor histidine kinase [Agromyces sp. C10]MCK8608265.1 PAS domain-containing sensor histidine kinase [Agromyces sp. C10]
MTASGGGRTGASATLDRSVVLSQLLFGAVVVVVVFVLYVFAPLTAASPLMLTGVVMVFGACGVAVAVPWHRLPRDVVIAVPLLDALAVGVMRLGEPASGVGLLWVFPTLWLATYFGVRGAVIAFVSTTSLLWATELATGRAFTPASLPSVVMLPVALVFVATSALLTSRRTSAQRILLRRQAEQLERAVRRLRRQQALLADVLAAVGFGVVRIDRDGRPALVNRAYAELYGLEPARPDLSRTGIEYAEDRTARLRPEEVPFARAARGEEFDDVVTWIERGDGTAVAVAVTARRLFDDGDEPDGSVLVARDVTTELRAVKARDDLVASVSHELRTPMTAVLGYVELSLDTPGVPEPVRRNLQVMERNGERMLRLVGSILESARRTGDEARVDLDLAPTDLAEVLSEAVESLRPRADEQGVALRMTESDHEPVIADAFRIRQVLDNVLSNAVKYNRAGGEVIAGVSVYGDAAWIVVRDSGIGIPSAELPRVFDRFYRSESVRSSSTHGSGLGLGIARDLVERHGGRVRIDSEEGSGTTVMVRLPVGGPAAGEAGPGEAA